MILLSIIVPYYNVSSYFERCIRSLMAQTIREEVEFIFVNDGSTDGSRQILFDTLSQYPDRSSQVRCIDLPHHQGVSAARTIGMKEARGEYLISCDSDDWVDPEIYQLVSDKITETRADVIVVPFIHEYGDVSVPETYRELSIEESLADQRWWGLCSHALRRSLIEKYSIYPITNIDFWEDLDLLLRYFVHASSIAYISATLYHYDRSRTSSVVHQCSGEEGYRRCQKVIEHLSDYFLRFAPQHIEALSFLKRAARDMYITGENKDFRKWSRTYPETWPLIWNDKKLSWPYRICYRVGSMGFVAPLQLLFFFAKLLK